MISKIKIVLEQVPYEMDVREDKLVVNDREFPFTISGNTVTVAGTPHTVEVKGQVAVVDGITYAFEALGLEQPKQSRTRKASSSAAGEEAGAITAIMPGMIIRIFKREGDPVKAGEVVVILEAMKMQNELPAKKSGVIKKIFVKEGDKVEMRQVILVIEAS